MIDFRQKLGVGIENTDLPVLLCKKCPVCFPMGSLERRALAEGGAGGEVGNVAENPSPDSQDVVLPDDIKKDGSLPVVVDEFCHCGPVC